MFEWSSLISTSRYTPTTAATVNNNDDNNIVHNSFNLFVMNIETIYVPS